MATDHVLPNLRGVHTSTCVGDSKLVDGVSDIINPHTPYSSVRYIMAYLVPYVIEGIFRQDALALFLKIGRPIYMR